MPSAFRDHFYHPRSVNTSRPACSHAQAKFEIIDKLFINIGVKPNRILFPTFNPLVLLLEQHYDCVVVADQSLKYSWQSKSEFVDTLAEVGTVDVCLALDEYFTYADSENT